MNHEFEDGPLGEQEFDEYLRRSSEVSQRYHELGERVVPPPLDAKVLRQAQQQAAKNSARRRSWLRVGAPLAFAATALIAITVVMQPEVKAPSAPQPVVESRLAESQRAVGADYEAAAASRAQELDESPALAPEKQSSPAAEASASSDAIQAPPPAEARVARARGAVEQPSAAGSGSVRTQANAPRDRLAPADQAFAAVDERAERRLRARPAPDPDPPVEEIQVTGPPPEGEAMKAPEPGPQSTLDQLEAARVREVKPKREEEGAKIAGSPAPSAPAAAVPVAPPPSPVAGLPREPAPPEPAPEGVSTLEADRAIAPAQWVRWIRDFRAQNDEARAEELRKRLRAAHPSFELPADIASSSQRR